MKELQGRVHELSVENQALLCEVEEYRREKKLASDNGIGNGSKSAPASLHEGPVPSSQRQAPSDDEFVVSGNGTYTDEAAVTLRGLHGSSNLLSCALNKDCTVLATGGADSVVSICRWGGALAPTDDAAARVVDGAARVRCDAPVICVGFGQVGGGASMVAAGCMDGSVKLVEYGAGVGDNRVAWARGYSRRWEIIPRQHWHKTCQICQGGGMVGIGIPSCLSICGWFHSAEQCGPTR